MYYFQIETRPFLGDKLYCELINTYASIMLNYNKYGISENKTYNIHDTAIELTKDEYDWFKANFSWFAPWVMDD